MQAQEERPRRGRLKVFFGASPGVGKTFALLEAAQRKRDEGVDVVIGWVETHGRAETAALAEGLERLPPAEVEDGGVRLKDFDLDGALQRRPGLLLLDELAHTNAPGSRHAKRWQDAHELLEAGIDLYTTLNVQHLESVNDLVTQITGVEVRETLPDRVLDEADEVEFVDLPPEDLLRRLEEGKVYVPEQAARAIRSFFRKGNLIALRELALRNTAEHVDAQMQHYRRDHEIERTWPVAERILVCIRPHPGSERLVRAARRMAARLHAEWVVAYVESPSQRPLSAVEREELVAALKIAEQMGAKTAVLSGESVSEALVDYAREHNVSKIVVGKPTHARWRDRLQGSLADQIVRRSGEVDVYFISGEGGEGVLKPGLAPAPPRKTALAPYVWSVACVVACTLVCWAMFGRFANANLIMVYLVGVCFVSVRYGRGPSSVAAVLSVAAFDFFFVPPYITFAVSDTQYVITFAVMLLVALLISTLGVRVREQAAAARHREQRTQVLYSVSRELAGSSAPAEIARVTCRHVSEVFRGPAVALLPASDGSLVATSSEPGLILGEPREAAVARWVFEHRQMAGLGTDTLSGAQALYLPLSSAHRVMGVLAVRPDESLRPLSPDQLDLLETLARQGASALERAHLAGESEEARLAMERERTRSTLLTSVSHDLRTPLAAITGAASSLLQDSLDDAAQRELKETIYDQADHLNRRVTNLLDMTRLESGSLRLRREWHSLEEVVGSALARLEGVLLDRRIETALPADLPLVPIDAALVEQVLVNLLENAVKYTAPESVVRVQARPDGNALTVAVEDDGPGLPTGDEERVFEKFYRGSSGPRGFGLGLPICRAIVAAHGGRIWAENRRPSGTAFRFTLPLAEAPPPPPATEPVSEPEVI